MVGGRSLHQHFPGAGRKSSEQNIHQSNHATRSRIPNKSGINCSSDPAKSGVNSGLSGNEDVSVKQSSQISSRKPNHHNNHPHDNQHPAVACSKWNTPSSSSAPSKSRCKQPNCKAINTPFSSSSKSSSSTPPIAEHVNPEIFFLIREHAKTVADMDKISRRLQELEVKVKDIFELVSKMEESFSGSKTKRTETNQVSDDSGGEYSRTTSGTGMDEDELLSLLTHIAKISDNIRAQKCHIYSPRTRGSLLELKAPSLLPVNHCNLQVSPQDVWTNQATRMPTSSAMHNPTRAMTSGQELNSYSALLFESDLNRFLYNLDIISEPRGYLPPGNRSNNRVIPEMASVEKSRKKNNDSECLFVDKAMAQIGGGDRWSSKTYGLDMNGKAPKSDPQKETHKMKNKM